MSKLGWVYFETGLKIELWNEKEQKVSKSEKMTETGKFASLSIFFSLLLDCYVVTLNFESVWYKKVKHFVLKS